MNHNYKDKISNSIFNFNTLLRLSFSALGLGCILHGYINGQSNPRYSFSIALGILLCFFSIHNTLQKNGWKIDKTMPIAVNIGLIMGLIAQNIIYLFRNPIAFEHIAVLFFSIVGLILTLLSLNLYRQEQKQP